MLKPVINPILTGLSWAVRKYWPLVIVSTSLTLGQYGDRGPIFSRTARENQLILGQYVVLEGPKSPKSAHKLVLSENVSIIAFYTVIMGEMDPKVAKLVNLAQIWTCWPL